MQPTQPSTAWATHVPDHDAADGMTSKWSVKKKNEAL